MNLTAGALIAELQRYPSHTPVRIECGKQYYAESDPECGPDYTDYADATDARFEGNHILIVCDD